MVIRRKKRTIFLDVPPDTVVEKVKKMVEGIIKVGVDDFVLVLQESNKVFQIYLFSIMNKNRLHCSKQRIYTLLLHNYILVHFLINMFRPHMKFLFKSQLIFNSSVSYTYYFFLTIITNLLEY